MSAVRTCGASRRISPNSSCMAGPRPIMPQNSAFFATSCSASSSRSRRRRRPGPSQQLRQALKSNGLVR